MAKENRIYLNSYRKPFYFDKTGETKKLPSWEILEEFLQNIVFKKESSGDTDFLTINHFLIDFIPTSMLTWGMKYVSSSPKQYKINFAFSMYNLDQASLAKSWFDSFKPYLKDRASYLISATDFTTTINNYLERKKVTGDMAIADFEDIIYVDNDDSKTLYDNVKVLMGKFDEIIIISNIKTLDLNLLYSSSEDDIISFPTKKLKLINKYDLKII
jgi:hypothetical protein